MDDKADTNLGLVNGSHLACVLKTDSKPFAVNLPAFEPFHELVQSSEARNAEIKVSENYM
jgi:hypothetical protein